MSWEFLWKLFLVLTLSLYSILVIIVFFGGLKNIKEMFEDLREPSESSQ